jgi:hypothetical protein
MNEKNEQPLATRLAAILELPPGASDANIVGRVAEWARERKAQQDSAAFAARVRELQTVTNMPYDMAVRTLAEQDREQAKAKT